MLEAVLFDLDNTLILYDEPRFYEGYFREIVPFFNDILSEEQFLQRLIETTGALYHNNGQMLNMEYFLIHFGKGLPVRQEELWNRFIQFYETRYDTLSVKMGLPEGMGHVFNTLQEMGVILVVATNPLFPESIQYKRLAWANLQDVAFALVTAIDNMWFCKPRVGYYLQICEKIGIAPDHCLMVGNDVVNDMVAAKAGLKTYLVTDSRDRGYVTHTVDRTDREKNIPPADFKGPLVEVLTALKNLRK